jgi:hypothetical protein
MKTLKGFIIATIFFVFCYGLNTGNLHISYFKQDKKETTIYIRIFKTFFVFTIKPEKPRIEW